MTRSVLALLLLAVALAASAVTGADMQQALGNHFVDSSDDSITVVPHAYFGGGSPSDSEERSLLHAAETISHHVDAETEQLAYQGIPGFEADQQATMVEPTFNQEVDPTFLMETASAEQAMSEEEALDLAEDVAHRDAQEMDLGLLETSVDVSPQYVTPQYKPAPQAASAPAAPAKPTVQYQPVTYKRAAPAAPAAPVKPAPASRKGQWTIAKTIPSGHLLDHQVGPAERAARARREQRRQAKRATRRATAAVAAAHPAVAQIGRQRRYCVARNQETKKCERRCQRCTRKRYVSPSFYQPVVAVPRPVLRPTERHLVLTPQGPVQVIYVSKRAAPQTFQQVAFHTNPRAVTQARRTTYRVASAAPAVPSHASAIRARRERAARKARQSAANTQYDEKTHTLIRHVHHHHFERAEEPEVEAQQQQVVVASVPTLERAYVKLCRLQKAIVAKYNNEARAAARWSKRRAQRHANRRAFQTRFPTSARVVARASGLTDKYLPDAKASGLGAKYSTPTDAANVVQQVNGQVAEIAARHQATARTQTRAQKLIARAKQWLERREKRRAQIRARRRSRKVRRHQAKEACRRRALENGNPIPERCRHLTRAERQESRELRQARREQRRLVRAAKRAKRWAAKRACRRRFYLAGREIPLRCRRTSRAEHHARRAVRRARAAAMKKRRQARRAARQAKRAQRYAAKVACRRQYARAQLACPVKCQRASESVRAARAQAKQRRAARKARRQARRAARRAARKARRTRRRLEMRSRRLKRESLKKQCRSVARTAGRPIPRQCRTSKKEKRSLCRAQARADGRAIPLKCRESGRYSIPARISGPQSPRAAVVHQSNKARRAAAKAKCRRLAREAGVRVPRRCRASKQRLSGKVFTKRYDEKTNRVRFAQQHADATAEAENQAHAEAEAAAAAAAESQAQAEAAAAATAAAAAQAHEEAKLKSYSPVDGLDYNQSPLIQALLKQLAEQNLVKLD